MPDRYEKARRRAYSALEAELAPLGFGARAGIIGLKALQAWRSTWLPLHDYSRDYGDWPWEVLTQEFDSPRGFDLAIWVGDALCALAIGDGVSAGFQHVTWNYVEGWRTPNPMTGRVLQAADFCVLPMLSSLGSGSCM
jgi:hypothetical protein